MSRRKVSPEAQIIALFTGLSDESKRMVMFGLNAIMQQEQNVPFAGPGTAPPVKRRSSRNKEVVVSTVNTGARQETVGSAVFTDSDGALSASGD